MLHSSEIDNSFFSLRELEEGRIFIIIFTYNALLLILESFKAREKEYLCVCFIFVIPGVCLLGCILVGENACKCEKTRDSVSESCFFSNHLENNDQSVRRSR